MTRKKNDVRKAWKERTEDTIEMLERMATELKKQNEANEDRSIDWGDAGTAAHYRHNIKEVHDSMFHLNEYAQ